MVSLSRLRLAVLLLVVALAPAAAAETLGWETCVREAAANNAELLTARANLDAAGERVAAARSGYFPQVSAGASRSESEGSSPTISGDPAYSASVTATQNLFAGFLDQARVEQAEANRERAAAAYDAARATLSQNLKSAYAGLHYAQENLALTGRIVERLEENLRLVELRFEGGRENKGSYLLTRASLEQGRYDQLQARQALDTARAQLARALGRRDAGELQVEGPVPLNAPPAQPDFPLLVEQAPDFRTVIADEAAATAQVRIARSGFYPSVDLSGRMAREGGDWFPEDDRRTLTASVTVPIFSGGRDYYGSRAASASLEAAAAGKDNIRRQLLVRLRQAHAGYVESVQKLRVDEAFVEAAETRARIARSKYNNGLMSFEDWDRIESDLILRNKSRLASQRDRVLAEAAWEQVQGKGVIP